MQDDQNTGNVTETDSVETPVTPTTGEVPGQAPVVEKTNIPVDEVSRTGEKVEHTGEQPAGTTE